MSSLLTAIKLVYFLLLYKSKTDKNITISDSFYIGVNLDQIPFKLYKPKIPKKHNIIIYPGASPTAEAHPGLVMLGTILAQAGYTVFIPRIPDLKKLLIQSNIVSDFGCFYSWVISNKKIKPDNISIIGISFGGAITLKVFTEKKYQNILPKSIITYGTYFDFNAVLNFLSTGKIFIKDKEKIITPNPWGLIVMFYNYFSTDDIHINIDKIKKILSYHIKEEEHKIEKELDKLSEKEQNTLRKILDCKIDKDIMNHIKFIIDKNDNLFNSLSPKFWCDKINTKTFIFHGANDSMIPYTESIELSKSISNSELLVSYLYEHKEVAEDKNVIVKIIELGKIIKFFYKFILYNEN